MKPDQAYESKYHDLLKDIILDECAQYSCRVFLFGSRSRGDAGWGADFDIGIDGLDGSIFIKLKRKILERVEESLIPWKVDIINFDEADESFKRVALEEYEVWKSA
jgi:uncharacterized protein